MLLHLHFRKQVDGDKDTNHWWMPWKQSTIVYARYFFVTIMMWEFPALFGGSLAIDLGCFLSKRSPHFWWCIYDRRHESKWGSKPYNFGRLKFHPPRDEWQASVMKHCVWSSPIGREGPRDISHSRGEAGFFMGGTKSKMKLFSLDFTPNVKIMMVF